MIPINLEMLYIVEIVNQLSMLQRRKLNKVPFFAVTVTPNRGNVSNEEAVKCCDVA